MSNSIYEEPDNRQLVDTSLSSLGERIRRIRKTRGLTQDELSALSGLTQQCISGVESGRREPKAFSLTLIAQSLNCSTDYLLLGRMTDSDLLFLLTDILKADPVRVRRLMRVLRESVSDPPPDSTE